MRILLAGGGTAGHINPAISIASYAKIADEKNEVLFVGKEGNMEQNLVPAAGFCMKFIDIEGFKRKITLKNIGVVIKTIRAIAESKKIIKEFEPDVVICTGGYVSGPVMSAASKMGIKSIIHEQNVFPGVTVKLSQKYATYIATSFEKTKDYLKEKEKCVFTGNPIRQEILSAKKDESRKEMGLDMRPFILAFGGSLGADMINNATIGYIADMIKNDDVQILFGTGKRNYEAVKEEFIKRNIRLEEHNNVMVRDYIYDMDKAMAAADIVIGRAGAISISEITVLGKASILIPSPNVAHNHQFINAKALADKNAARVITEDKLSADTLKEEIDLLLSDREMLINMENNAKTFGVTDASEKIYSLAKKIAKK